jgi:hypothetical protein
MVKTSKEVQCGCEPDLIYNGGPDKMSRHKLDDSQINRPKSLLLYNLNVPAIHRGYHVGWQEQEQEPRSAVCIDRR